MKFFPLFQATRFWTSLWNKFTTYKLEKITRCRLYKINLTRLRKSYGI